MTNHRFTRHAEVRANHRACRKEAVDLVLTFGDVDTPARHGVVRQTLSDRCALELIGDGYPASEVERARRTTCLLAGRNIVTLIKHDPQRRSRRRRRALGLSRCGR